MPTPIETFVLVVKRDDGSIHHIVRTYLSYRRAQEDCELIARQIPLLKRAQEDCELIARQIPLLNFEVLTIDHIDN